MSAFAALPSELDDDEQRRIHQFFPMVVSGVNAIAHVERLLKTGRNGAGIRPTDVVVGEPLSHYLVRTGLHSRASAYAPNATVAQDAGRWWDLAWKYWQEELKVSRPDGVHVYGWGLWLLLRDHQRGPLVTFDKAAPSQVTSSWVPRLARLDRALATRFPTPESRWAIRWAMLQHEAARPDSPHQGPHLENWARQDASRARERHLSAGLLQAILEAWDQPEERAVLLAPDDTGRRRVWTMWEGVVKGMIDPAWQGWPTPGGEQKTPAVFASPPPRLRWSEIVPDPLLDHGAANLLAETLPRGLRAGVGAHSYDAAFAEVGRWPWNPGRAAQTMAVLETLPEAERGIALLRQALLVHRPPAVSSRPRRRS